MSRFLSAVLFGFSLIVFPHSLRAETQMKWIPPGEFTMGTDDPSSMPNERPAYKVKLDGFHIDEHLATNADFSRFVNATGYVTTAEKPIDWNELSKQLPAGTEKPPEQMLAPGSLVFTPPAGPVDTSSLNNWWAWTPGASWNHPQGPQSSTKEIQNHPVVHVSWDDANAYCKWAKKRLPTEAEWEFASRGTSRRTRFWWGDEFRPSGKWMTNSFTGEFPYKNTAEDGFAGTSPVGAFPPNGFGLTDMAGNVWQWTSTNYRADAHEQASDELKSSGDSCHTNPSGPSDTLNPLRDVPTSPERVIKGGSFLCHVSYCESYRPPARRGMPIDTGAGHVGFRCVR